MRVFVTGTDTDIGKTIVCSWLCSQLGYSYFKPIQTGCQDGTDSDVVRQLTNVKVYDEAYKFEKPLSPHLASREEGTRIDLDRIHLPNEDNLIVEGAGGVYVPINENAKMIDLMLKLDMAVILVASSKLGTINHTLLSLEALKAKNIPVLGVIISNGYDERNKESIEYFGNVTVLDCLQKLKKITKDVLCSIELSSKLKAAFR